MANVLQLKIRLSEIKPEIWRQVLVEDSISFEKLHEIFQLVMGWDNYHLYKFKVGDTNVECDEESVLDASDWPSGRQKEKFVVASDVKLSDLIKKEKQKFSYTYDFGDNWRHEIVVEKVMGKDNSKKYPRCVGGERACAPEDCGGAWGYYDIMEIRENKKHPEYKERIIDWLGEDFDPEEFNIEKINKKLSRLG